MLYKLYKIMHKFYANEMTTRCPVTTYYLILHKESLGYEMVNKHLPYAMNIMNNNNACLNS